jgi:hypothetical protein
MRCCWRWTRTGDMEGRSSTHSYAYGSITEAVLHLSGGTKGRSQLKEGTTSGGEAAVKKGEARPLLACEGEKQLTPPLLPPPQGRRVWQHLRPRPRLEEQQIPRTPSAFWMLQEWPIRNNPLAFHPVPVYIFFM